MKPIYTAAILLIGDELLKGELQDRNGFYCGKWLNAQGFEVRAIDIVADDTSAIAQAAQRLASEVDLLCMFGGLGPTSDDKTTVALAQAFSLTLRRDEAAWQNILQRFAQTKRIPPPGNDKQAMIPTVATMIDNAFGTAPGYGFWLPHTTAERKTWVVVLPGPPKENQPMLEKIIVFLQEHFPKRQKIQSTIIRTFGLPESEINHRLKDIDAKLQDTQHGQLAYQFHFPEILVKLRHAATAAQQDIANYQAEINATLAPYAYSQGEKTLFSCLAATLIAQSKKVTVAESCTGGLLAKLLTDVDGSSKWFERGFITYSNQAKEEMLGVRPQLLAQKGAVSQEVAREMLVGALDKAHADCGIAITGIAGPTGGSPSKPVGTVCIAWGSLQQPHVRSFFFSWDREANRLISAWTGCFQLLRWLEQQDSKLPLATL